MAEVVRGGTRTAFGHAFEIVTPVPELTDYLAGLFAGLPVTDRSGRRYELVGPTSDGTWRAHLDGELIDAPGDARRAVALLLWRINRSVIDAATGLLVLHAGGVVVDGTCVLLAGDMEVGKTTLTAGLLRGGAGYLSDEAIGLELAGERAHGYAKALSLDPGSWELFPELEPTPPPTLRPFLPAQWQVPPQDIEGVEVVRSAVPDLLVLPRYEAGATLEVERLWGAVALQRLAACVFSTSIGRPAMLDRLASLLGTVRCYDLRFGSLEGAVETIRSLAVGGASPEEVRGTGSVPARGDGVRAELPSPAPTDERRVAAGEVVRRPRGVHVVTVDGETVAHVATTDELHLLSPLGSLVLDHLGDDASSVPELQTALGAATSASASAAVARTVDALLHAGLVVAGRPGGTAER
jgi:hypothetical protein